MLRAMSPSGSSAGQSSDPLLQCFEVANQLPRLAKASNFCSLRLAVGQPSRVVILRQVPDEAGDGFNAHGCVRTNLRSARSIASIHKPRPWRSGRGVAVLAPTPWLHRPSSGQNIGCQILGFSNGSSRPPRFQIHVHATNLFRPPRPNASSSECMSPAWFSMAILIPISRAILLYLSNFTVSSMRASILPQ